MLYLLKRGAIFPLGGDGMYINPPKTRQKKFMEGWTEEDHQNYLSDLQDYEEAGLPDWQKYGYA